jgi:hypothetical protein
MSERHHDKSERRNGGKQTDLESLRGASLKVQPDFLGGSECTSWFVVWFVVGVTRRVSFEVARFFRTRGVSFEVAHFNSPEGGLFIARVVLDTGFRSASPERETI